MANVIMPITTGLVVATLKAGYLLSMAEYAADVVVQPKLPAVKVLRMVTVRDDSGPDDGVQTRRRQGVNVWAESSVIAEHLALLSMAILRQAATGDPITATDSFSGPFEVEDAPFVVDDVELSHFYFSFRLTARGADF